MTAENIKAISNGQIDLDGEIELETTSDCLELYEDFSRVGQELNHQHDKINKILVTKQKLKHFIRLLQSFQIIEDEVFYGSKDSKYNNNTKKGSNKFINHDKKYQRLLSEFEILKSEKNQIEKNLLELKRQKNKNHKISKTCNGPKPKSKPMRVSTLDDDLMRAGLARRFTNMESNERSTS